MDALSATGLRSIRYSLECKDSFLPLNIIANDISDKSIETIKLNVATNGVENVSINHEDAR